MSRLSKFFERIGPPVQADDVISREFKELEIEKDQAWGISLSGGGIRSAAFSIGVLQALEGTASRAKEETDTLLSRFDYLSSVSGGGYAGVCLTWFRRHYGNNYFPFGEKDRSLTNLDLLYREAHGSSDQMPQECVEKCAEDVCKRLPDPIAVLDYIRLHGKYLVPTFALDTLAMVSTVIQGMLLSGVFYFTMSILFFVALILSADALLSWLNNLVSIDRFVVNPYPQLLGFELLTDKNTSVARLAVLVGSASVAIFLILMAFRSVLLLLDKDYYARIRSQKSGGRTIKIVILSIIVYSFAVLQSVALQDATAWYAGIMASLVGLQATYARFRTMVGKTPLLAGLGNLGPLLTGLSAAFFLYLLFFITYFLAYGIHTSTTAAALVAFVFLLWLLVPIDTLAIGNMYRDRLMEVFLPSTCAINHRRWNPAPRADKMRLSELVGDGGNNKLPRPYHLINTNAVLINEEDDVRLQRRGGTSFLLSPFYVGSDPTGYVDTQNYQTPLTLSDAMSISGAAASPNTGVGGEGETRGFFVALLMSFFGIRLGHWVANPSNQRFSNLKLKSLSPTFLSPGLPALLGMGHRADAEFLDLTDGGHFENLGLYELFRRRCRFIVASDAGADEKFSFADLGNAVARARIDFGISVRFHHRGSNMFGETELEDDDYDLEALLPGTLNESHLVEKFGLAKRGYALAEITYPPKNGDEETVKGVLVYLKTTLTNDLPADIYGYKSKQPSFPDQTTTDQFFDEFQFEAYRELGYEVAKKMTENEFVRWVVRQRAGDVEIWPENPSSDTQ